VHSPQEVCPWNERFAREATEPAYTPRADLDGPTLIGLAERLTSLSGKGFLREFAGSPVIRTGRKGLLRNVCVALGNWGDESAVPALEGALSDQAALVRGHAAWALGRIRSPSADASLSSRLALEDDGWVRDEIERGVEAG
jgi:epoxyqueuosine reductase